MKKIIACLLLAVLTVSALCVWTLGGSADDTFTWDEESATICVLKDVDATFNSSTGEDTYPWAEYRGEVTKVIVGDEVTKLSHAAFSSCPYLSIVECGKKCSYIDMDAFAYNACLTDIIFHCPVTFIGQGTVYSSDNLINVTLTNQTKEEFLKIASKRSYNDAYKDEFLKYTILDDPTLTPEPKPEYIKIDVKPYYDCIENWNGNTYFIVGGTDPDYCNRTDLLPATDGEGNVTAPAKYTMKLVVVDETEGKTYTVNRYAFDNPTAEIYGDGSFLRVAAPMYGIPVLREHKYTVTIEFYEGEKKIAAGTSATGAFDHGNADFNTNGQIVPDPVPHTYEEAQGQNPDDPPVVRPTGDNTAVIAALAICALFGSAVVFSKKVFSD